MAKREKPEAFFDRVVANAFDFLGRALEELKTSPKYSVIHFYSAVELLLKARLLAEHWSLVVSKRQEPDLAKFLAGDFVSVTLDDANERLTKVVRSGLTAAELQQFRALAQHRNRMVHFFHEADGRSSATLLRSIAKEQLTAWYFLHKLLRDRWASHFKKWKKDLDTLNKAMKVHRAYLEVTYEQLKPELRRLVASGEKLFKCGSCEFPAYVCGYRDHEYTEGECRVCELSESAFETKCPKCQSAVRYVDEGWVTCDGCGKGLGPKDLESTLEWGRVFKDKDAVMPAHCTFCDGYQTVDDYHSTRICLSCFRRYDEEPVRCCNWCSATYVGPDIEDSFWSGCPGCDGKSGDVKDD